MLVSTAIVCAVLGVVLQFAIAAQSAARTQGEQAELQQRLRVAVEAIRRDLIAAGAGPSNGPVRGRLIDAFAPVLPARVGLSGADAELSYGNNRISLTYVADTRSQTRLVNGMSDVASPLRIDGGASGCPPGNVCGFSPGDRAVIYEQSGGDGGHDVFTVSAVDPAQGWLSAAAPLSRPYPAGSRVAAVVQRVYYHDRPGKRLMVYDGDRSDVPVVDHVVDLRFTYYGDPSPSSVPPPPGGPASCAYAPGTPPVPLLADLGGAPLTLLTAPTLTDGPACGQSPNRFDADLLRVRRIGVTIRLEAESAEFRTPADANRLVPDLQVTFDVAPRNMAIR
jgi:hypothetical protein